MSQVFLSSLDQDPSAALIPLPVGPLGLDLYEVPDGQTLMVTSVVLWVEGQSGQGVPTLILQVASPFQAPPVPGVQNALVWRSSPDDRRLETSRLFQLDGGQVLRLRSAGAALPAPSPLMGYSISGVLL